MKVLSFGEILFDIIEHEYFLGGAPLNFASHLSKLGAEPYMLSRVGEDDLGNNAIQRLTKLGIRNDFVTQDQMHPTGTVTVTLEQGHPDYVIHSDVAYDFIELDHWDELKNENFDVLYFGTLAQRGTVSAIALDRLLREKSFKHIFYDVNLRKDCYRKSTIKRSLEYSTIFKLNDEEVEVLSPMLYGNAMQMEDFIRHLSEDYHIETIIVTAGSEGSFILNNSVLSFVKSYPANVKDTVGAGDSFSAAFLYTFFYTSDILLSLDRANFMGAFVASSNGAIPEYTTEIKQAFSDINRS